MPIQKRWTRFTVENVKKLPNERGAYELANNNKRIVDIGGSDSESTGVRGRLLSHLRTNKYPTARYFRAEFAGILRSGIGIEASHSRKYAEQHRRRPQHQRRSARDLDYF